jgi:hypothetical protein
VYEAEAAIEGVVAEKPAHGVRRGGQIDVA